jgi:hypothetical protein
MLKGPAMPDWIGLSDLLVGVSRNGKGFFQDGGQFKRGKDINHHSPDQYSTFAIFYTPLNYFSLPTPFNHIIHME